MSLTFVRGCTGKVAYPSRADAIWAIKELKGHPYCYGARALNVYRCAACSLYGSIYHIGHRGGSGRKVAAGGGVG
jgi:hypothetical protein